MSDLTAKHCKPCEGGVDRMSPGDARGHLAMLDGWTLSDSGKQIRRTFEFRNFYETMAFVNAVAYMAHREDHHPDMEVGYKTCTIRYTTHAIGGLSENDFICAAKVDAILRA